MASSPGIGYSNYILAAITAVLTTGTFQHSFADEKETVEEISVVGQRLDAGYISRQSQVGLGFASDPLKVPQSVQVITRRMLEDQKPMTLADIVRNTSGTGGPRNSIEPFNGFKLRGFSVTESATDGIRNTNSLNIQSGGLVNVEQVEILRGPGGALYGLGSPGGVVNIVTRKPLSEFRAAGSVRVGNFDSRQVEADLTGPLTKEGDLAYRLIAEYGDRDSFVDFVGVENWQIAPSLQWSNDSGLSLRYQGDWRRREGLRYISLPVQGTLTGTDQFELPRSLYTGEPDQGDTVTKSRIHTFTLEQEGDDGAISRLYGRFTHTSYDQPSVAPANVAADGRTLNRRFNRFVEEQDEWIIGGLLVREIDAFGLQHKIAIGADYAEWSYDSEFLRGTVGPLDLLQPVYGSPITNLFTLANSRDEFEQLGGFIQDYISIGDNINLLLGVRWDRLVNRTFGLRFNTEGKSTDSQLSPRAGLSWEVVDGVAPYVSYSETFVAGPNFGFVRSPDGDPFGPQDGRQWEVGVKFDLFNTLTATVALFDIEQSNVPTVDPNDPAFRVPTGEQRSRGFEVSGAWAPGQGLDIMGSYAYTDAEVTEDTNIPSGSQLDNVPKHTARLLARYARELDHNWTAGISGGLVYSSSARIAIGSNFKVPDYTVLEAGLFVSRGPLIAELKVDNLTNNDYFLRGAFGGNGVIPGDARRIVFSVGWRP